MLLKLSDLQIANKQFQIKILHGRIIYIQQK